MGDFHIPIFEDSIFEEALECQDQKKGIFYNKEETNQLY